MGSHLDHWDEMEHGTSTGKIIVRVILLVVLLYGTLIGVGVWTTNQAELPEGSETNAGQ